jgi:hypothetical protein
MAVIWWIIKALGGYSSRNTGGKTAPKIIGRLPAECANPVRRGISKRIQDSSFK